jgi:holin-like protein
MLKGLCVIFVCLSIGDAFSDLLHIPIPGSVFGMLLLAYALKRRIVGLEGVERVADVLTSNLGLLFVPPGVGLISYYDLIKKEYISISISILISTFLVLALVGLLHEKLGRKYE